MDSGPSNSLSVKHYYAERRLRLFRAVSQIVTELKSEVSSRPTLRKIALYPMIFVWCLAWFLLSIIDLVLRWMVTLIDAAVGDRGYLTVGSIVGAYLAFYGLIDASHQRGENRASLERSTFVTLVSSNNPASFVVALKRFGKIQSMKATAEPELLQFWSWTHQSTPNMDFMYQWALHQFPLCLPRICSLDDKVRIDLAEVDLDETDLHDVDLHGADLHGAHLTAADLHGILEG
jgi:hypothetical protein